jgi:hypothetical protein
MSEVALTLTGAMGCCSKPALHVFTPKAVFCVWRWAAESALPCTFRCHSSALCRCRCIRTCTPAGTAGPPAVAVDQLQHVLYDAYGDFSTVTVNVVEVDAS